MWITNCYNVEEQHCTIAAESGEMPQNVAWDLAAWLWGWEGNSISAEGKSWVLGQNGLAKVNWNEISIAPCGKGHGK